MTGKSAGIGQKGAVLQKVLFRLPSKVAASLAFDLLFRSVVHEKPEVFQR